jgi:hypothetical protein
MADCSLKRNPTMKESEWRALHGMHGEIVKKAICIQPRSYRLWTLICPCGARFIYHEDLPERETKRA